MSHSSYSSSVSNSAKLHSAGHSAEKPSKGLFARLFSKPVFHSQGDLPSLESLPKKPTCPRPDDSSEDDSSDTDDSGVGIQYEPVFNRAHIRRSMTVPEMPLQQQALLSDAHTDVNLLHRYSSPRLVHRGKHADILLAQDLHTLDTVVLKAVTPSSLGRHTGKPTLDQARQEVAFLLRLGTQLGSLLSSSSGGLRSSAVCVSAVILDPVGDNLSFSKGFERPQKSIVACADRCGDDHRSSGMWQWTSSSGASLAGVVHTLCSFTVDQQHFTVLEHVAGVSVIELIADRGGRLSELMCVAEVVQPLLVTLNALHAAGVVHRQVQPEHVLCHHGKVCLIDFLHAADLKTQRLTSRVGALEYMAPEVIDKPTADEIFHKVLELGMSEDDLPTYDEKCDVWSLGVVVYEALTGCQPFSGYTAGEVACQQQAALAGQGHGDGHPLPALIARHTDLSPQAQDFLRQSLQLDPAQRASAARLLQHPWLRQLVAVQHIKVEPKNASDRRKSFRRSFSSTN